MFSSNQKLSRSSPTASFITVPGLRYRDSKLASRFRPLTKPLYRLSRAGRRDYDVENTYGRTIAEPILLGRIRLGNYTALAGATVLSQLTSYLFSKISGRARTFAFVVIGRVSLPVNTSTVHAGARPVNLVIFR